MRNYLFVFIIMLFTALAFSEDEGFETDRLPIGDPQRKFDFCTVKLDEIYNAATNLNVSYADLIASLKNYRIVMVGETHTNQLHHDVQLEVIKGLTESGKQVCLALEMFNPSQNKELDKWTAGQMDEEIFMQESGFFKTWGHNYRYYQAIFKYAREHHIPIYGVNTEGKYTSKISRQGLAGFTADELKAIPEIDTSNVEHRFFFKVAMQGLDATMPAQFKNIYPAQCLWDAAMGEGAIEAANKRPEAVIVVLAGSGHVIYNLGIGRIIKARSDLPFASVVPVDVPQEVKENTMMKIRKSVKKEQAQGKKTTAPMGKMEAMNKKKKAGQAKKMPAMSGHAPPLDETPYRVVIRSLADFMWGKKEQEKSKYPSFGFSIKESENKNEYLISRVLPETIAIENGLKRGDIVLAIDGKSFENLFQLKKHLHFKNWDEEINFKIIRDKKEVEISFVIKPLDD